MSINEYLFKLESFIDSFSIVSSYNLNIDKKTEEIAFISGRLDFRDGSVLDFKEFVESTESGLKKYKYAYNYRTGRTICFRYDNAQDPRARKVKSFPNHKHLKNGEIVESKQILLSEVLGEIEKILFV